MAATPISKQVFNISRSALDGAASTLAAIDRGCSLTKAVYVSKSGEGDTATHYALHCVVFANSDFEGCLHFLKENALLPSSGSIRATGTGCEMYQDTMERILGLKVEFIDEFLTAYRGVHFFLTYIDDKESAFYPPTEIDSSMVCEPAKDKAAKMEEMAEKLRSRNTSDPNAQFPCIFLQLGSAAITLIIHADGKSKVEGVSMIGGKTLMGLGRAFAGTSNYDELMELAENGNSGNVDTIVEEFLKDDPNSPYGRFPRNLTLFPFGKLVDHKEDMSHYRNEDRAAAVVNLVTTVFANLIFSAMQSANVNRVVVGGHGGQAETFRKCLNQKLNTFSFMKAEIKFLKTGATGAIGALIAKPDDMEKYFIV